jgi:hypothetical protein
VRASHRHPPALALCLSPHRHRFKSSPLVLALSAKINNTLLASSVRYPRSARRWNSSCQTRLTKPASWTGKHHFFSPLSNQIGPQNPWLSITSRFVVIDICVFCHGKGVPPLPRSSPGCLVVSLARHVVFATDSFVEHARDVAVAVALTKPLHYATLTKPLLCGMNSWNIRCCTHTNNRRFVSSSTAFIQNSNTSDTMLWCVCSFDTHTHTHTHNTRRQRHTQPPHTQLPHVALVAVCYYMTRHFFSPSPPSAVVV